MAFVFDDISAVSLEDESDSTNEYLFLGLSLSYEKNGEYETVSILKNDETDGDFLIETYKKIQKKIPHITPRMLSKELKELELNGVVKRAVYNTVPVTVEYELTSSGFRLKELIAGMIQWGVAHREYVKSVNIND